MQGAGGNLQTGRGLLTGEDADGPLPPSAPLKDSRLAIDIAISAASVGRTGGATAIP